MTRDSRWIAAGALLASSVLAASCGGSDDPTASGATSSPASTSAPDTAQPVIDPGDGGNYAPVIDPADFVDTVDNSYMPLPAGARWVYEGEADGETERVEVVVTGDRKEILGISATVVRDTVSVAGEVVEDTLDWFAQDRDGNVWYLGEESKDYENGEVVSTKGSWEAGVDGAFPGIVMLAEPTVANAYRQEYYRGEAEDMAEVLRVGVSESVPAGDFEDVVVTRDWNPLEPEVIEEKYYAPGVGLILERKVAGADGVVKLIETSVDL